MSRRTQIVHRMRRIAVAQPWRTGETYDDTYWAAHRFDAAEGLTVVRLLLTFDLPDYCWHLSITRPDGPGIVLPVDERIAARWRSAFFGPHEHLVLTETPAATGGRAWHMRLYTDTEGRPAAAPDSPRPA